MSSSPELQISTFEPQTGIGINPVVYTRRDFLKLTGLASVGLTLEGSLVACTPRPEHLPSQPQLVANIKNRLKRDGLDLDLNPSEEDIRKFIDQKTYAERNWMKEQFLGILETPAKGSIRLNIAGNGEVVPYSIDKGFYYPEPLLNTTKIKELKVDTDITVYIYGTNVTQGIFSSPENKEILDKFAKDFFKDSRAEKKALHLNFMPIGKGLRPVGVNDWDPRLEQFDAAAFTDPDLSSQNVLLNLNKIHVDGDFFGFDNHQSLIRDLVNENVNMVARSRGVTPADPGNEAPSTIFGFLAQFDPQVAKKILRDNYFPFVLVIEKAMNDLKKISRAQLVNASVEQGGRRGFLLAPLTWIFPQAVPFEPVDAFNHGHIVYTSQIA